jgi:predicted nuclease of predicted toxin-antitoxin system
VKFLVDNQLPRALVPVLTQAGHEAAHVLDIELAQSNDHAESFKNSLSTIEQELNTGEHLIELY